MNFVYHQDVNLLPYTVIDLEMQFLVIYKIKKKKFNQVHNIVKYSLYMYKFYCEYKNLKKKKLWCVKSFCGHYRNTHINIVVLFIFFL